MAGEIIYKGTPEVVTVATAQTKLAKGQSKLVEETGTGKLFLIAKNAAGVAKKVELI